MQPHASLVPRLTREPGNKASPMHPMASKILWSLGTRLIRQEDKVSNYSVESVLPHLSCRSSSHSPTTSARVERTDGVGSHALCAKTGSASVMGVAVP